MSAQFTAVALNATRVHHVIIKIRLGRRAELIVDDVLAMSAPLSP
jgi:hypothetical protein